MNITERHGKRLEIQALVVDSVMAVALNALVWAQLRLPRLGISGGPPIPRGQFRRPFFILRTEPTVWAYLLVALCFLPLALRRRYPMSVLATVTVASALYTWLPHPPALTSLGVLIALYTVGTQYPRGQLAIASVATAAVTLWASLPAFGTTFWLGESVRIVALLAAAALLGDATRNRRAYISEVENRALEAERTREEEARRRVDEERLRIARELHDITAHSLSIIAVQSGMAKHVIGEHPEESRRALEAISETSRSALNELRSVINVLRGVGETNELPRMPAPSLSRLDALARPLEEAGLEVEVDVLGDTSRLSSLVDASGYRIVQEALTNVMRHAEASRVEVRIDVDEDDVRLLVRDNGLGSTEAFVEGHGMAGMRERALALGGSFSAGPIPGDGFEVTARLPLKGPAG